MNHRLCNPNRVRSSRKQRGKRDSTRTRKLQAEILEKRELLSISPTSPVFINQTTGWGTTVLVAGTARSAAPSPVSVAAVASSSILSNRSASLSVLGAFNGGEANLTYTWTASTLPSGATTPIFSNNGVNSAKNTTVTFSKAGTYTLVAKIADNAGHSVTSTVKVTISQIATQINITPGTASLAINARQKFTATGVDQFGYTMASVPNITWSTTSGTISSGTLTVPTTGTTITVTATNGSVSGSATVAILQKPTVAVKATAAASTVKGLSTSLSVLGTEPKGESFLTYTWAASALPGGATSPTFSDNGTNSAKNTTVTFSKAGTYNFVVTIADDEGHSITSSVKVVVSQVVTQIVVTPGTATLSAGAKQQFTATGFDQFGNLMASIPSVSWSTTGGTISSRGLLTVPALGTTFTVTAVCSGISSSAAVTIIQTPTVAKAAATATKTIKGSTVALSVLGAEPKGESCLTYTWAASSMPTGALAPTFSDNGTNSAKNATVTFGTAGAYTFTVTIADDLGHSITSRVSVTVSQTLSQINVAPGTATLAPKAKQQFAAAGYDQFGNAMAVPPKFSWSTTVGSISSSGLLTAPSSGQSLIVTARSGVISSTAAVTLLQAPSLAVAAAAASSTVTGACTTLSVLGADSEGESGLVYTWSASTLPSGATAPTYSDNTTNSAKSTTVTFTKAGTYNFVVTIANRYGLTVTSSVRVTVSLKLSRISVTPASVLLFPGVTQQFSAAAFDQFNNPWTTIPTFTWSTTAGSISSKGLLTTPMANTTITVTATSGSVSGSATVTTNNQAPTVATAASSTPGAVTGATAALVVLGADDGGEANLKYTWGISSKTNPASSATFSLNGTNAAKNTTVTFDGAGTYTFFVNITDATGLTTSSSVSVVVNQTLTQIVVTPSVVHLEKGATQQFAAAGWDQFGDAMAGSPAVVWSSTAGSIDVNGLLTAPNADGTLTVTAVSGGIRGSVCVSVGVGNFLNLNNAALAQLTQSLDADGSISRLDMIQILRSLADGSTLSTTEFADLKTIVSNASLLNMSDYVRVLANDVINGNTANAHYLGQTLGNLAVGSTSVKLTQLIDKWFLGADHPGADAQNYYNGNQNWSYQRASGTLFVGAPTHLDEYQGLLGDCYFISALGSIADRSVAAIQNMFVDNGDNTWTVRFYANGAADYVTVDRMLPVDWYGRLIYANYGSMATNSNNALWLPLAEKAYAQWNETGREGRDGTNLYSGIEGGWMSNVDAQVLGYGASNYSLSNSANMTALINAMNNHLAVTIGTIYSGSLPYGLYGSHAYAIVGYNSSNGTFTLYNPWGSDQPTSALTWAQLQATCSLFTVADPSGSVPFGGSVASPISSPLSTGLSMASDPRNLSAVDAYFRSLC